MYFVSKKASETRAASFKSNYQFLVFIEEWLCN